MNTEIFVVDWDSAVRFKNGRKYHSSRPTDHFTRSDPHCNQIPKLVEEMFIICFRQLKYFLEILSHNIDQLNFHYVILKA